MTKNQLIVAWAVVFLSISTFCYSEDTGLKDRVDSQGNAYQVDDKGDSLF